MVNALQYTRAFIERDGAVHPQSDMWIFAEMTRALVDGRDLYVDYWDIKPPGFFFTLSPFLWVFQNTLQALTAATLFVRLVFIVVMAFLAHEVTKSKVAALVAAVLALEFSSRQIGPETTFAMATYNAIAVWLCIRGHGRPLWMLLSGAVFGMGILTKQPLFVAFPAMLLFAAWYAPQKQRLKAAGSVVAGLALFGILVLIWAWSHGILDAMLYRVVDISAQYVMTEDGRWHFRPETIMTFSEFFLDQTWPDIGPLVIQALVALLVVSRLRSQRTLILIIVFWIVLSIGGASIPRALKADYFTQAFPSLILLIALAVPVLKSKSLPWQFAVILISGYCVYSHITQVTQPTIADIITSKESANEDAVVAVIAEHALPGDCLWMWGNISIFNYLSGVDSCTSGAHSGFVTDDSTFPVIPLRIEMLQELLVSFPRLHIQERAWGYFPAMEAYAQRYQGERIARTENYDIYTVDRSMWHETAANFDNEIRFIGYDLLPTNGPYCPGDTLTLAMTWQQISTPTEQYQMFVHLLTQDETARLAGYDGPPEDDLRSNATNTWVDEGEIVLGERFDMAIPADAKPGTYKLIVGLYDVEAPDQRLPVLDANGAQVGSYAVLQELTLDACAP